MTTLYHYTCSHSRDVIGDDGVLLPGDQLTTRQLGMPWTAGFVWLTDLATPVRDALGLTSNFIRCDRTRYRYRVLNTANVFRWVDIARRYDRDQIEHSHGARPMHWWVSAGPVPVIYDPIGGAQ